MDTLQTIDLRSCCTERPRSSLQMNKSKDKLEFFKDIFQLVDRVDKESKEVQASLCPVAIRLENKYKCCKARIADIEGKLEKAEEENEILKDKLNAIELLSRTQHCKFVKLVAIVKDVAKTISDILTELQSGENLNAEVPQTIETRGPDVSKKVSGRESSNIFKELSIHVNNRLKKWVGKQMHARWEIKTLFEDLKKIEEGLSKSKTLNVEELPRIEIPPSEILTGLNEFVSENCSEMSIIKPLPKPTLEIHRFADGKVEIISANGNNDQNKQSKDSYSNKYMNKTCQNIKSHNLDRYAHEERSNTGGTCSIKINQQSALSNLPKNDKLTDVIEMEIEESKKNGHEFSKRVNEERYRFLCQFCGKLFSTKSYLQLHLKNHMGQRDHKCEICDKIFASKKYLTLHVKAHLDDKKHKCSICDRKFIQKCDLMVHMRSRSHTNEKPYKCNSCGKCFTTGGNLKNHEIIHSGEKPYKCSVCSASFGLKGYLKQHERIHANLRLYSCSQCPRKFIQRSSLRSHLSTQHSPNRVPAFHCIFCDKAFQTNSGYYRHIRAHVGESRVFCEYCDKGFWDRFSKDDHIGRRHSSRKAT